MSTFTSLPCNSPLAPDRNAIARLSHTHEQIVNWLLENPHRNLRECSDHFGYSQSWLSQIIHSDIFQAHLRGRQDAVFIGVANDIPAKLRGLADVAIEKVTQMLEKSEDPTLVVDVFDKTLHRLGYAPQKVSGGNAPVQVNMFAVSREELAAARMTIASAPVPALEMEVGFSEELASVSSGSECALGAVERECTPVPAGE